MNAFVKNHSLLSVIVLFFITACVKDVDFDQANDTVITPSVGLNVTFFEFNAGRFVFQGVEQETVTDTTEVRFNESELIVDYLVGVEFLFEFLNSIARDFSVKIDFLNTSEEVVLSLSTNVARTINGELAYTLYMPEFDPTQVEALKQTFSLAFELNLISGSPPLNENSPGRIGLRSKVTFNLRIEDRRSVCQ